MTYPCCGIHLGMSSIITWVHIEDISCQVLGGRTCVQPPVIDSGSFGGLWRGGDCALGLLDRLVAWVCASRSSGCGGWGPFLGHLCTSRQENGPKVGAMAPEIGFPGHLGVPRGLFGPRAVSLAISGGAQSRKLLQGMPLMCLTNFAANFRRFLVLSQDQNHSWRQYPLSWGLTGLIMSQVRPANVGPVF